jgi:hypothetical protein
VALEPEPVALEPEPVALEPETAPEVATAPVAPEPEPEPEPEPQTTLEPETPRTIGRLVADTLRSAGVRYAFTVPGESFLGILDVLEEAGIRVVATRHEGGAAFMAEAYGQLTGRPALCLATRAVGASNLAIGIHTARQDSTPLFALVGDVARAHAGREAFQAADLVGTIGGLAKWSAAPRTTVDVAVVPAQCSSLLPRTSSMSPLRPGRRSRPDGRRPSERSTTRSARSSISLRGLNARSSWPAQVCSGRERRPT